jgi:hypothetical protein
MTFDKNTFKEAFRSWVQAHPRATDEEALAFCQSRIPVNQILTYHWLMEQSLQWFQWLRNRRAMEESDLCDDEDMADSTGRLLN